MGECVQLREVKIIEHLTFWWGWLICKNDLCQRYGEVFCEDMLSKGWGIWQKRMRIHDDTVDGCDSSESPVENGGKHPIIYRLSTIQSGGAGFRWPIHSMMIQSIKNMTELWKNRLFQNSPRRTKTDHFASVNPWWVPGHSCEEIFNSSYPAKDRLFLDIWDQIVDPLWPCL